MMRQRIETLDGLRFMAALGVLWIHAWSYCGNPRFYIGRFDVASLLAIGGNGVDLFFVISGFCMYYFYASKTDFSYHDFCRFLIKRWARLSPAFYAATLVYAFIHILTFQYRNSDLLHVIVSVFYLNSVLPQFNVASHFWTLGVEWQFYLIVPFLLIYQNKAGFRNTFKLIFGTLLLMAIVITGVFKNQSDYFTDQIFFRGIEFGFGVLAARLLRSSVVCFTSRIFWFFTLLLTTYIGRVLISAPVLNLSLNYHNFFKLAGFSLLSAGFAGILYLSVTSVKWLNRLLGNRVFKTMGKISYSFYLWHVLVIPVVTVYTRKYMPAGQGFLTPVVITIFSAVVLYPVSLLSYHVLEKPFLSIGNLSTK